MRVVKVMPKDSTELSDILVEEDPLYGGIYISPEHLDAWQKEFNTEQKAADSLVEEMAELIQAINKQRRSNKKKNKDAIVEEMAHVLISLKGLCRYKMITPGEIEQQIQAKWPAAYEPEKGECKDLKKNVAVVTVANYKAYNLEKAFTAIKSERESLDVQNGSLKEVVDILKNRVKRLEDDNSAKAEAVVAARDRGDYWNGKYNDLARYWDNTSKDIVSAGKKVGVKINIGDKKYDNNTCPVYVTNEKALGLAYELNNIRQQHDKKWQAMTEALKDKGVEVIYMGEEDGKPIVDVKISAIDTLRKDYIVRGQTISDLKREIEGLKARTLDKVEIRLSCGDIVWTYCDGNVHISTGIISADQIASGTVPKCSSCAHYERGSRSKDVWCHKPVSKEGPGTIRRLSTEEAEGPACADFKARKE